MGLLKIGLLWLAVVCSAVAVAYYSHLCRQTYGQLTAMQREANQLQVDYGRYLLEQSAWGSLQRVESMAVERLGMHMLQADEIVMVKQ
ncbi:MAG: cell division protein FtsL [Porticoccaceae bacterium]|nr:cell division protein FtsL [Porticoccaceae bacterium]